MALEVGDKNGKQSHLTDNILHLHCKHQLVNAA